MPVLYEVRQYRNSVITRTSRILEDVETLWGGFECNLKTVGKSV